MARNILYSFVLFLAWLFAAIIGVPVVAVMLLTKWNGRTTLWGNEKWGRGTNHFDFPTKGWWQEFVWLALRNPANNLATIGFSIPQRPFTLEGKADIGDKKAPGFYKITSRFGWEYYWIKPYNVFKSRRCIRIRIGWKINGNTEFTAPFVFVVHPWKKYRGA